MPELDVLKHKLQRVLCGFHLSQFGTRLFRGGCFAKKVLI